MRWLRKYYYFILLIGTGIWYMSMVDHWHIYEESLAQARRWQGDFGREEMDDGVLEAFSAAFGEVPADSSRDWMLAEAEEGGGQETGDGMGVGEGEGGEITDPEAGELAGEPGGGASQGVSEQIPEEPSEPVYCTVEDDYFADAVFIGDSRTVGMFEYGGLEETAAFYATTGLTVYKIFDSEIVSVPGQKQKITVEEALENNTFAKIYLMIGINEMGTGTVDSFLEKYREVVDHLKELQPDAIIYLQAIIKVTTERSNKGDYINNEGIEARNEGIAQMADNVKTFYLDVNPSICDESGGMEPSYTFDGVHLKAKYIEIWKDFLKTHAISS